MKTMAGDYPELTRTILEERDLYLARSIWEVCGLPVEVEDSANREKRVDWNESEEEADENDGVEVQRRHHPQKIKVEESGESSAGALANPVNFDELSRHETFFNHCCSEWPGTDVFPRVVVAVVGIGHVAGIKKAWPRTASINKAELCRFVTVIS